MQFLSSVMRHGSSHDVVINEDRKMRLSSDQMSDLRRGEYAELGPPAVQSKGYQVMLPTSWSGSRRSADMKSSVARVLMELAALVGLGGWGDQAFSHLRVDCCRSKWTMAPLFLRRKIGDVGVG